MHIPPGTQTHKVFRLKGKGMPTLQGYGKGDQFVRVILQTPTHLREEERRLLREFARLRGEKVEEERKFFHKFKGAFGR
jgi:molecular chaperone DnaJ